MQSNPWQWNPDSQNPRGGTWGPETPIPGQSQPSTSWDPSGHWDFNPGTGTPRQRFDPQGNPITPQQAHPPKCQPNPPQHPAPLPWWTPPYWIPGPFPFIINPCLLMPWICAGPPPMV